MECDNKSVVQGAAPVKGDVPRFAAAASYGTPEFCIAATLSPLITGRQLRPGLRLDGAVEIAAVV